MGRPFTRAVIVVSVFSVSVLFAFAQVDTEDLTAFQSQATSEAKQDSASSRDSGPPPESKKPKKVWTNENLGEDSPGAISKIGDVKNGAPRKTVAPRPASSQVAAIYRKQLAGFQMQLNEIDKQIADLKSFSKGEFSQTSGLQMHKSYSMEPIPDQIVKLEEKRKVLASRMDAALDAARKRGIQPGQLR